uniref:HSF_DOMAIN domain-containing protein n=1 Tax=Macrostomum lignano TaxID=282301 RepID=A0A1I8JQB9_9PLAT
MTASATEAEAAALLALASEASLWVADLVGHTFWICTPELCLWDRRGRGFAPTESERALYAGVVNRIRLAVAAAFKLATQHDEYWHSHVDKDTYGSFHYTSLLYLANYAQISRRSTPTGTSTAFVEPRTGRVSAFTSGSPAMGHVGSIAAAGSQVKAMVSANLAERSSLGQGSRAAASASVADAVMNESTQADAKAGQVDGRQAPQLG